MADEITIVAKLTVAKGNLSSLARGAANGITPDMAGTPVIHNTQQIGTSEEAIVMGDVSTPGWAWFKNLDDTNYVEIRPATGVADLLRLNPGEECVFRFAADATAPFAIANTGAVYIEYVICNT